MGANGWGWGLKMVKDGYSIFWGLFVVGVCWLLVVAFWEFAMFV